MKILYDTHGWPNADFNFYKPYLCNNQIYLGSFDGPAAVTLLIFWSSMLIYAWPCNWVPYELLLFMSLLWLEDDIL